MEKMARMLDKARGTLYNKTSKAVLCRCAAAAFPRAAREDWK